MAHQTSVTVYDKFQIVVSQLCFKVSCAVNHESQETHFIGILRSCHFRVQLSKKCHDGRWNLGLLLWYWDQGSEFSMESPCSPPEKKVHCSRSNIKAMLCFWTLMEVCELNLYPGILQWTLNIIRVSYLRNYVHRREMAVSSSTMTTICVTITSGTTISIKSEYYNMSSSPYSPALPLWNFWDFPQSQNDRER